MAAPAMLSSAFSKPKASFGFLDKIKSKPVLLDPEQQKLQSAIEDFKSRIEGQESNANLLTKMQTEYTSLKEVAEANIAKYDTNIQSLKS